MSKFVLCDSVTVAPNGKSYTCDGVHVVEYLAQNPATTEPPNAVEAGSYFMVGFAVITAFVVSVMPLKIVFLALLNAFKQFKESHF